MVLSLLGGKISSRWLTSVDKSTFVTYGLFLFFFYLLLQVKKRRREVEGERGDFRRGFEENGRGNGSRLEFSFFLFFSVNRSEIREIKFVTKYYLLSL